MTALLSLLALFLFPSNPPATVALTWSPSTNADVVGYNLYFGAASRSYTNVTSVGNVTAAKISGLAFALTYYFAATAVDQAGLESVFSNEVSVTTPSPPAPPSLSPIVTLTAQWSDWLWGGWTDYIAWEAPAEALMRFWRVEISAEP